MELRCFLYRLKQRANYHLAKDDTARDIAEINKYGLQVRIESNQYVILPLDFHLPKKSFDFVFRRFDLFVSNAKRLNGRYAIENGQLLFSWDQFKVAITSASELFIINEIYVEGCYTFMLPPSQRISVIDIGMNVGLASLSFASLPYVTRVFSFEPFKPTYDLALKNLARNPHLAEKIEPRNVGLGMVDEVLEVAYNAENSGVSSTMSDNPRNAQANSTEHLEVKSARDVIEQILSSQEGDFMIKMDTEGAEYAIFENLFKEPLENRIKGIMMEWHFKGAQPLEDALRRQGFRIFSFVLGVNSGLIYGYR